MDKDFEDMTAEEKDAWADAMMADVLEELGLQNRRQGKDFFVLALYSIWQYNKVVDKRTKREEVYHEESERCFAGKHQLDLRGH